MDTRALVRLLSDGAFHSGAELGERLGVSRTSVWNDVQALEALGIPVDAVRGKGYRVPGGLDLLDARQIRDSLRPAAQALIPDLDILDVIDSTNAAAVSRLRAGGGVGYACLAECQTAGRGRRGRQWFSPYASAVYLTLVHEFSRGFAALEGLSLAVGVAACEGIESLGVAGVGLKWPNDLVARGSKLGGILIEVFGDVGGTCQAVIGIGVNVDLPRGRIPEMEHAVVDLRSLGLPQGRRNDVAIALLNGIAEAVIAFEQDGFAPFVAAWDRFDCLSGQTIDVVLPGSRVTGRAAGIDADGGLIVDTADGPRIFRSGEVSVRGWQ